MGYNFYKVEIAGEPIGSEWIGDAVCSDDPEVSWYCSDPRYDTAACCNEDGTCEALAWENCRGAGQSWGYTVDCDPNPCPNGVDPEGACCDHLGACTVTTEAGCEEPDQWQGAETVCDPNPCIPFGVCCVPEPPWVCTITREVDCPEDSIWDGDYWVCEPNPCHQIPTESMSWGKLKTLYR